MDDFMRKSSPRSIDAELPFNPYLTTPRERRVFRFSSDSDDDYLPDLIGSPRPRSSSPPRPPPATPASVYETARQPPKNKSPPLPGDWSRPVVVATSSFSYSEELVIDTDSDSFEPDRTGAPLLGLPTIRSSKSTSNRNSMPIAPLPASLRNKGGKTVSSIQVGKLPANHDHYDFLESLGEEVPPQKIHPEAIKYVRNFGHWKHELAQKLMRMFDERVFNNKLRDRVTVVWNKRLTQTGGRCFYSRDKTSQAHTARIELSTKVCDSAERVRDTLLHELCHAATQLMDQKQDGHGPYWKRWANLAHSKYPQLPIVERYHHYFIETKYIYLCRECGWSLNRHSKSLNMANKVCDFCEGYFDLYTRQEDGSLSRLSNPRVPKTPLDEFAQFVKDNYGSVNPVSATKKHRDVMRRLTEEFEAN